jgi:hypothetical protein
MRVVTRLARTEFRIGAVRREGDRLVLESHPDQPLKVKAYLDPDDVLELIKATFGKAVLGYLLALPVILIRQRRARVNSAENPAQSPSTPTVPAGTKGGQAR